MPKNLTPVHTPRLKKAESDKARLSNFKTIPSKKWLQPMKAKGTLISYYQPEQIAAWNNGEIAYLINPAGFGDPNGS